MEPLYLELHTYVRHRLIQKYGAIADRPDGMIPAHLLGNMWAQEWGNVYDIVAPPAAPATYNIGEILNARKTQPKQLVGYGEDFFKSLGFQPLPATFWVRSQFVRPRDRDVVCHASAWDVDNDMDVRLKMCIHISSDDFVTVHHELGHNFYQMAYRTQPFLFRSGANDGFHEAIGDAIALSITPEYLKKIGLIEHGSSCRGGYPSAAAHRARQGRVPALWIDDRQVALGGFLRPGEARGLQQGVVGTA